MDGVFTNIRCPTRVEIVGVDVIVREISIVVGNQVVVESQVVWVVNQPTIPKSCSATTTVVGKAVA